MVSKQDFESFYSEMWGERWFALKEAMLKERAPFERCNRFAEEDSSLAQNYLMDKASMLAAQRLDVSQGEKILDMCAAPGGKSLILIESGVPENITLNEISQSRKFKLIRVLKEYLPEEVFSKIKITNHDASKWCLYEQEAYDKILLDAPCSGERHVMLDEKEFKKWTPSRTKSLAKRQYALLASALIALKPGGTLVYSTCSVSRLENDLVIQRLLKKKGDQFQVLSVDCEIGEKTEFGWQVLPDQGHGWGPIYFAKLKKV